MRKILCGLLACLTCCLCGVAGMANVAVRAEENLSDYADVINAPEEQLVHAPTLVREIQTEEELTAFVSSNKAAAVIFTFRDGNIQLGDRATPAEEVLGNAAILGKVIPIFKIATSADAESLTIFLKRQNIEDCFVMSETPALVKEVREECPMIGGMLDMRGTGAVADEVTLRDTLNVHMAKVALVDEGQLTTEQIHRLQALLMQVWVDCTGSAITALSEGVDGVVGDDEAAYALIESLPEYSLMRKPFVVAHRGLTGLKDDYGLTYNENTVRGARAAVSRAGADAIEIDVYLTQDGHLVVMHDNTLDRTTNGKGMVESMTLAQIQTYEVVSDNTSGDPIPTLDDFFQEFSEDDVYFFIEIKSGNPAIVSKLKSKIGEYSMGGRVAIISFSSAILEKCREVCPEYSVGLLVDSVGLYIEENYQDVLKEIRKKVGYLNGSLHVSYSGLNDYALNEDVWARAFGIHTWTYRNLGHLVRSVADGFHSLTTDYPDWLGDIPQSVKLEAEPTLLFYEEGGKANFPVTVTTRMGDVQLYDAYVMVLDGDIVLSGNPAEGYTVEKDGKSKVLFYIPDVTTGCYFYSDVTEITLQKGVSEKKGCFGGMESVGGVMLALAVSVAAIRKRKEND